MATEIPSVAAPPLASSITKSELPSFDERWAAWQAKGAAHDQAVGRKMAIAGSIVAILAVVLYLVLGR